MKLLKPSWVNHDDKPIFSVDIHPAGKRFATGGQGGDSGRVVVWNLNPVLFESVEVDPNVPKMLCQMDNHLACVNSVRWSNGGKYLASGGDDGLVMVWCLSVNVGTPGKHKAETWRCLSTLRGHAGDVLDLAWSPLDKWLASCSVDNTIIIWNAEKFPEIVVVLNGHTGLVKGVTWDPVGKYLASQSDDKSLRVWKTSDWAQETVIKEPFYECGAGTTHVLRLSWSPDGQYVLSAHAMNGGGPTAQVVERDGWRCDKDFVGHRKAVTCSRFNSNIFVKEGKKCCCAAVGSRDRALSIWLTSLKRPLVVVHDLFSDSVLDLSWSSDGLNLLACSSDGTVACIQFTNKEIGTPLTLDEKAALYEKIYGKCLINESADDFTSNLLVECPDILLAREQQEAKKEVVKDTTLETTPKHEKTPTCPAPLRPMDRQIETRTSDGKRRITPVFIPYAQADANESLGSQPGGTENCFSTSSQSKSRIRVEVRDDIIIHPNVSNHATPLPTNNLNVSDNGLDSRLRKRAGGSLPGPRAGDVPAKRTCTSPTTGAVCTPPTTTTTAPPTGAGVGPLLPSPALGLAGPVVRAAGSLRLQVVNKACNTEYGTLSRLQLIPNNSASNDPVWETYLGSAVTCIACDARWACVCCADAALHAWALANTNTNANTTTNTSANITTNITGYTPQRALPPIVLPSPAARLTLNNETLAVVTTGAQLAVWDLASATCLLRPLCFRELLSPAVTVTNCVLLEGGNPMISLSNGKSYIYCKKLCAWVVWSNPSDAIWRACAARASSRPHRTPTTTSTRPARLPPALYPRAHTHPHSDSTMVSEAARSWLEAHVSSCLHLRLAKDYRHWVASLFEHLVNHGTEDQLRSILDDMLGPSHCTSTPKKWQPTILGINKHEILEQMLSLLIRQLRWQRLYTEYAEQLSDLKEASTSVMNGH